MVDTWRGWKTMTDYMLTFSEFYSINASVLQTTNAFSYCKALFLDFRRLKINELHESELHREFMLTYK